jgi:hypothetical protein
MAWRRVGTLKKLILTVNGNDIAFENWYGCNFPVSVEEATIFANAVNGGMYYDSAIQSFNPSLYGEMAGYTNGVIDLDSYASLLGNGESMYIWREETGRDVRIRFIKDASNRKFNVQMEVYGNYIGYSNLYYNDESLWQYQVQHHSGFTFILDDEGGANIVGGYWFQDRYNSQNLRYAMNMSWKPISGDGYTRSCIMSLILGQEIEPVPSGGNPYEGGGYSEPTDETGDFDETSDIIEEPTLPASLAVASGFLTVYNPTYTQVVDLGNYVWNSLPVDTLKKMFSNPMDVIIGLSIFPFLIDDDSRNWEIMIGNINSHVVARKARNQFQTVDCGKLYIKPYSKSYLDYSPYTKIELALPYIGTKQLDTDIIMGKWIWVKYRVDLISGGCMAILSFSDTENGEYSVIAEYTGKCNIEIPISGSDFRELGRGILQAVAGTGAILLSNGAVGGDWVGSGLANMVTGMKPNIERSGGLTSCIGLLGVQKPRIIKTIPRQCVPENQAQLQGYPVLIKDNFANLEGFTSFEEVSIKGARMTEREKQRAKALLESGVIK